MGHQHLTGKRQWHSLPVAFAILIVVCILQAFIAEPSHLHASGAEATVMADRAVGCRALPDICKPSFSDNAA